MTPFLAVICAAAFSPLVTLHTRVLCTQSFPISAQQLYSLPPLQPCSSPAFEFLDCPLFHLFTIPTFPLLSYFGWQHSSFPMVHPFIDSFNIHRQNHSLIHPRPLIPSVANPQFPRSPNHSISVPFNNHFTHPVLLFWDPLIHCFTPSVTHSLDTSAHCPLHRPSVPFMHSVFQFSAFLGFASFFLGDPASIR